MKVKMKIKKLKISLPVKVASFLVLMFSISCIKLCAETMTTAQAQVYREKFVDESKKYVGSPYAYGSIGPDSFDCSGLIYHCARESVKIQLPRTAKAIYSYVRIVPEKDREVGDLLFFKTNSTASVTHVGIYIGNSQFISAISDGPNTGVIVSSLNQDYWKGKYVATGQFIPSGKAKGEQKDETIVNASTEKEVATSADSNAKSSFLDDVVLDVTSVFGWSLFTQNGFMFQAKAAEVQSNVRYKKWVLQPGIGFALRYNFVQRIFQIPLYVSLTMNDFVRFYIGPVFSFGEIAFSNTFKKIIPSVLPGIIGISFSTPNVTFGKFKFQLVQDVSYTVFNNMDGAALSFNESIASGLNFFTGMRVTFPLSVF